MTDPYGPPKIANHRHRPENQFHPKDSINKRPAGTGRDTVNCLRLDDFKTAFDCDHQTPWGIQQIHLSGSCPEQFIVRWQVGHVVGIIKVILVADPDTLLPDRIEVFS